MKLVLFDIDGTLLLTDGAGRRSMEGALEKVFGTQGDPGYRYDGKTDRQIARDQMRWAGFTDAVIDERMDEVLDAYLDRLTGELSRDPTAAQACAGVTPLLDALEAHEHVVLGLLTGNIRHGAEQKLRAVGIDASRFRVNAFGCDHELRPELPGIAQQRAHEALGLRLSGEDIIIIGDTPADIHCGRALGVRSIGVATGRYTVAELGTHSATAVFEDLSDTDAVMHAILS